MKNGQHITTITPEDVGKTLALTAPDHNNGYPTPCLSLEYEQRRAEKAAVAALRVGDFKSAYISQSQAHDFAALIAKERAERFTKTANQGLRELADCLADASRTPTVEPEVVITYKS